MSKVLVTGATGFIGRHCLPLLVNQGFDVHAITPDTQTVNEDGVTWHEVNLLNSQSVHKLMDDLQPSHLLHLAWITTPNEYWTSQENLRWLQASLELLQAFARHGGKRVVVAGTCAEYDWRYGYCSEAITPLLPSTLYGASKHALQLVLAASADHLGLSSAWGRIFFLYGPYEHPLRLVPYVIRSILQGKIAQCSHGRQIRSFLYVADVADAFVQVLASQVTGPINIDSGIPVTLEEIISLISAKLQRPELIQLGARPSPPQEPSLLVGDTGRLARELNWHPHYNLDLGLDKTINWWRSRT